MIIDYKKLEIYDLAHELVLKTYELLDSFPDFESNNLVSQLRRAITCLPLNIAEGSGARSYKIFLNYLVFCYRSCLESESALRLSRDLKYIGQKQFEDHFEMLDLFIRKLYRYMEYLESRCGDRKRDKSYFYRHEKNKIDRNRMSSLC